MQTLVKVIEPNSQEVLYECPIAEIEKAYEFATLMENNGIDVEILAPTITKTLIDGLGASEQEIKIYEDSIRQEMEEHDAME